jgi:hypothetical protein
VTALEENFDKASKATIDVVMKLRNDQASDAGFTIGSGPIIFKTVRVEPAE